VVSSLEVPGLQAGEVGNPVPWALGWRSMKRGKPTVFETGNFRLAAGFQDRSSAESTIGANIPSMISESASWFHATVTTSSSRRGLPSVG
jgi:hypothetical protein